MGVLSEAPAGWCLRPIAAGGGFQSERPVYSKLNLRSPADKVGDGDSGLDAISNYGKVKTVQGSHEPSILCAISVQGAGIIMDERTVCTSSR